VRGFWAGIAAAVALGACAPAALGATAGVDADGVLTYRTTLGETSQATITCGASSCTIADPAAVVVPTAGCRGFATITCSGVTRRDVVTGAGDDALRLGGGIGGEVSLGAGADAVDVRNGTGDDVACGAGADRVTADGIDAADATCETVERNVHVDVADATAGEGDGTIGFPVRLTERSAVPVSVSWATADGSATAPADYAAASGTVTFAPFETEREVSVTLAQDAADEPDETFTVTLSDAAGAPVGRGTATGTIVDDDAPRPAPPGDPPPSRDEPGVSQAGDPALDERAADPGAGGRAGAGGTEGAGGGQGAVAGTTVARRCVVPRVRGQRIRAATRALVRSGCILARVVRRRGAVRRGRALRTDPAAGRTVARGALVTLYVSRGR
jgi:hypothetical protein